MDSRQALKTGIVGSETIVDMYLSDLSDADLLKRPVPGAESHRLAIGAFDRLGASDAGNGEAELDATAAGRF